MIKVNLLREQNVHVHDKETTPSSGGSGLIFLAMFVIAVERWEDGGITLTEISIL